MDAVVDALRARWRADLDRSLVRSAPAELYLLMCVSCLEYERNIRRKEYFRRRTTDRTSPATDRRSRVQRKRALTARLRSVRRPAARLVYAVLSSSMYMRLYAHTISRDGSTALPLMRHGNGNVDCGWGGGRRHLRRSGLDEEEQDVITKTQCNA